MRPGVAIAHAFIRIYQLSLSGLIGRQCRHMPSCSEYMDEAIHRHGFWAGGWMGFARLCRCHPWGTSGLDFVRAELPQDGRWYRPWRYGLWRSTSVEPGATPVEPARHEVAAASPGPAPAADAPHT